MVTALSLLAALLGLELTLQHQERSNGLWLPHDEPGRKWALLPIEGRVNHDGFNERDLPLQKPDGVWRVVVLGDSVAYGGGLTREQNLTRVAERELQAQGVPAELINLSVYGYDAEQIAATLRSRGWRYAPDLVVYAAYTNDGSPSRLIQVGEARSPVYVGTEPDPTLGALGDLLQRRSALYRRWRGARYARALEDGAASFDTDEEVAFMGQHLAHMAEDARAHATPLLVFALAPHVMGAPGCQSPLTGPGFCEKELAKLRGLYARAEAEGLPTSGVLPWLLQAGRTGWFNPDFPEDVHHPGAEGHALYGQALAEVLLAWRAGQAPLPGAELPSLDVVNPDRRAQRPKPERPPRKPRPSRDP
ncbi:MAG: SGNH/GDSL hydrolase family protein [Alphaproteobacteria bacterium]|nr:SGNH/GDSL hydrolase family protein [Alphaproteobacteria bacterium]